MQIRWYILRIVTVTQSRGNQSLRSGRGALQVAQFDEGRVCVRAGVAARTNRTDEASMAPAGRLGP